MLWKYVFLLSVLQRLIIFSSLLSVCNFFIRLYELINVNTGHLHGSISMLRELLEGPSVFPCESNHSSQHFFRRPVEFKPSMAGSHNRVLQEQSNSSKMLVTLNLGKHAVTTLHTTSDGEKKNI